MPRYGKNIDHYFEEQNKTLSNLSIYDLGLRLINIFQVIHSAGFTYNDLKLDNLLIGFENKLPNNYTNGSCFEDVDIHLVDYGFSTRYVSKKNGEHIA